MSRPSSPVTVEVDMEMAPEQSAKAVACPESLAKGLAKLRRSNRIKGLATAAKEPMKMQLKVAAKKVTSVTARKRPAKPKVRPARDEDPGFDRAPLQDVEGRAVNLVVNAPTAQDSNALQVGQFVRAADGTVMLPNHGIPTVRTASRATDTAEPASSATAAYHGIPSVNAADKPSPVEATPNGNDQ